MVEHRQSVRKPPDRPIEVLDVITGRPIGRVGNLSVDGMLLISQRALPANALFQLSFSLPSSDGSGSRPLEIGVNEQWGERASAPGQFWTGFHIIDISREDQDRLTAWVTSSRS
jgi:hypothetical protein